MSLVAKLRELLAGATPGRWICGEAREDGSCQVYAPNRGPMRVIVPIAETETNNGPLIAALQNAAPRLLAVVAAAEAVSEHVSLIGGGALAEPSFMALRTALRALESGE